jgi:triacylglycerol lipase
MSLLTESEEAAVEGDVPRLPTDRWWGDHLREVRWQLELGRLLVDPVFRGGGVPTSAALTAQWSESSADSRPFTPTIRRVALIGHSRGGHYARALGHRRPELVSHAIAIGAGLRQMLATSYPTQAAARGLRAALLQTGRAGSSRCLTEACDCAFASDFAAPFPADRVRLTSIYSKEDGVVRWQSALVRDADCVEVTGSHVGLIFNRKTYRAIASTLAVPALVP